MPTSTQVPQHTIADSLQLPVPNMTVFPLAMGQHEFDFFHLFNTDNLQVDSLSNLARFTEVPWDKFDANCSSDLESLLDSFSHHQNCAAYILQITCVALVNVIINLLALCFQLSWPESGSTTHWKKKERQIASRVPDTMLNTINAKRRHRIYKSTGNAQGSSCKGNSEPENATKCSFEEPTGIDIQAPNLMDTNQKDSKIGWNRSRKRKASTPPTAGRAKTPPTVNRERLQKMLEGDDDAWEESWQESAAITAQQQYMTAIKMGKSVTLEYFRAKDFVKTNTSDSATHPIAKSCMPE
uniref:Uncharacterized protein n=1 Tax=Moniliophthora roreri TaxID=221103 RepID=A0A0W0EZU2_MONRR